MTTTLPRLAPIGTPIVALAAAALLAACGEQGASSLGAVQADRSPPKVSIDTVAGAPDSVLAFAVNVSDDLDVARLRVTLAAPLTVTRDTTLPVGTKAASVTFRIPVPASIAAGTPVRVSASAWDGARNAGVADTTLAVGNVPAPTVRIVAPAPGSPFVVGKASTIGISAASPLGVRRVGWIATGSFGLADSVVLGTIPRIDSIVVTDTVRVPQTAQAGVLTITPFVVDSAFRRVTGLPVAFSVQTGPVQGTVPTVTVGSGSRLEAIDTLQLAATDQAGIARVGYELLGMNDSVTVLAGDSVASDGSIVNLSQNLALRIPTGLALPLRLRTFAVNASGARGYARAGALARIDTVVFGITNRLPSGGRVADGLFHPRFDRLYLTNIERNTLEVFDLASLTFQPSVIVGSRPWGITGWPRDRTGAFGDTLVVANSGGTNVSYVDLRANREVFRYPLPNIIVSSITTVLDPTGGKMRQATLYDFSDRPQFVAMTCGPAAGSACGDPILVYSTTPTPGQSLPFPSRGTVRWENLRQRTSHFFYEQALGQTEGRSDTLRIVRYRAALEVGTPDSTVLLDDREVITNQNGESSVWSAVIRIDKLAFRDTTYVRNSGNFRRAMLGEGGPVLGSRSIMYDATVGLKQSFPDTRGNVWRFQRPVVDDGISPPMAVSDVIANSFSVVRGVALNFDGMLGAIRADSTYLVDPTLRLQGLLQTSGGQNAGFDFHPQNTGVNGSLTTRLAFSASAQPQLEVYDTWCFRRIATILVRDPIIGPVKASVRSNGQMVLVGATNRGVIVIPITQPLTSTCS